MTVFRHQNVVFDSNPNSAETVSDFIVVRIDVQSRLDRKHHPGLEHSRRAVHPVQPDVMHVHAEPVTRAMHVIAPIRALLDYLLGRSMQNSELTHAVNQHAQSNFVRIVEMRARLDRVDRLELCVEHDFVQAALQAA